MANWRKRRLLSAMVVTLLALLGVWLVHQEDRRRAQPREAESPRADYYLRGFSLQSSDEQGRWRYRIDGERMLHFPQTGVWTMESPTMTFFTAQGSPWYGRAERGRAWSGGEEAELLGPVELWRPASEANRAVTLDTRDVYLRPQENYAETAAPVVIQQERFRLEGVGARAYLDKERYELLSQVRGRYVPAQD